jgi:hypothetical protein
MYIGSYKYDSFPVVAICATKFGCSFAYASFATKDVDRFNKNEEQQDKIKRTLQYPKAGSLRPSQRFDRLSNNVRS